MESCTWQESPLQHQNAGHFRNYYLRNQAMSNDNLYRRTEQKQQHERVPTVSEITDFYLKKSDKFSSIKELYEKTTTTRPVENNQELHKINGELQKTYLNIMQKLLSHGNPICSKNSSENSSLNFNANPPLLRQTQSLNVNEKQMYSPRKIQSQNTYNKISSGQLAKIESQKNEIDKGAQNTEVLKTSEPFKAVSALNSKDTFVECKKSMHQNLINISSNLSTMLQESCAGINDICQKVRLCLMDASISYQFNKAKLEHPTLSLPTLDYQTAKKELNTLFEVAKSQENQNNISEISVIIEEQGITYEHDYEEAKKREIEKDLDKEPHKETIQDKTVENTRYTRSITPFFTILKTESSKTRKEAHKFNEFLSKSMKEIEKINNFEDFLNSMVEGINNEINNCYSKYPKAILTDNDEKPKDDKQKKKKCNEKKKDKKEDDKNKAKQSHSQIHLFQNEDDNSEVDVSGNWSGTDRGRRNAVIFEKTDFSIPDVYKKRAVTNIHKKLIAQVEANDSFIFFQKLMKHSPKNTPEDKGSRTVTQKSKTIAPKTEKKKGSVNDLLKKYEDSLWFRQTAKRSKTHTTKNIDYLKTKKKWQNLLSRDSLVNSSSLVKSSISLSQKSSKSRKTCPKQHKNNSKSKITLSPQSSKQSGASISGKSYNLQMNVEKPLSEADRYRLSWMRCKYAQMTKKNLRYMDILDDISNKDLVPLQAEYPRRNEELIQKPNIKNSLLYQLIHNKNKNNDEAWSLLLASTKCTTDIIRNDEDQVTVNDNKVEIYNEQTSVDYAAVKKVELQKLCTDLIEQVQKPSIIKLEVDKVKRDMPKKLTHTSFSTDQAAVNQHEISKNTLNEANCPSEQDRKYENEKVDTAKKLSKYIFSSDEDIIKCQSQKVYTVMPAHVLYNNPPLLHMRKNTEHSAAMLPLQPMKEVKEGTLKRGEWSNDVRLGPKPMKVFYDPAKKAAKKDERLSARHPIKSVLSDTQMKIKEINSWSPKNFSKYCPTSPHAFTKQILRLNSPKLARKPSPPIVSKKDGKSPEVFEIFTKAPNATTGIKKTIPKTDLKIKQKSFERFNRDTSPPSFMFDMSLLPKGASTVDNKKSKRELEKMLLKDKLARSIPEQEKKIWERKYGKTTGQKLISFVESQPDKYEVPKPKHAQPKILTLPKPLQAKVAKQQAQLNALKSLKTKDDTVPNEIEKTISVIEDKLVDMLSKPTLSNSIEAFDEMEKEILCVLSSMKRQKNKKTIKHDAIKELPVKLKTTKPNCRGQNDFQKAMSVIEDKMVDILNKPELSNSIEAFDKMEQEITSALNSITAEKNKKNVKHDVIKQPAEEGDDDIADQLLKRLEKILDTSSMSSLKNAKQNKSEKLPSKPKSSLTKRRTRENKTNKLPGSVSTSDEEIPVRAAPSPKKQSRGGTPVKSINLDRSQKSITPKPKTPKTYVETEIKESNNYQNIENISENIDDISSKTSKNAAMGNESVKSARSIYQTATALRETIVNVAIVEQEQSSRHESPAGDQGSDKKSWEDVEQTFSTNLIGDQGDKIRKDEHKENIFANSNEIEKEEDEKQLMQECEATFLEYKDTSIPLAAIEKPNTPLIQDICQKQSEFICSTLSEDPTKSSITIYGSPQWSPVTQNRDKSESFKEEIKKIKANEVVSEEEINKIQKIQQEITDCIMNLEESIATKQKTVENTNIQQADQNDVTNEKSKTSEPENTEKQCKAQTIESQNILGDLDEVTEESSSFYDHVNKIISTVENVYNQLEDYDNESEEDFTASQRTTFTENSGSYKCFTSAIRKPSMLLANKQKTPTHIETFIKNDKTTIPSNLYNINVTSKKEEPPTINCQKSPSFYNVLNFLDNLTDSKESYTAIEIRTVRLIYFATIVHYPMTLFLSCMQYITQYIPAPMCLLVKKPKKSCLKKTPSKDQGIRIIDFTKDKERVDRLRKNKKESNEKLLDEKDLKNMETKQVRVPRVSFHMLQEEKSTQVTICPYHSAHAMKILSKHQLDLILDKPPQKINMQVTAINTVEDKSVDAILEPHGDSMLANTDSILEQSENNNAILDSNSISRNTSNQATNDSESEMELTNYEEPESFIEEQEEKNQLNSKHQSAEIKKAAASEVKIFYDNFYVSSLAKDKLDKADQDLKVEESYDQITINQVKEIMKKDKDSLNVQEQASLDKLKNQQDIQQVIVATQLLNPVTNLSEFINPNLLQEAIKERRKLSVLRRKSSTEELRRKSSTESMTTTNLDSKCSRATMTSRDEGLVKGFYVFVYLVIFTALNFDYKCI